MRASSFRSLTLVRGLLKRTLSSKRMLSVSGSHTSAVSFAARAPLAVSRSYDCYRSFSSTTNSSSDSRLPFLLADIGEGIKEVELLQWFVGPGDHVQQFDKICEVQSDKATVEITSRYDGVVSELAGHVGDMLQVGQPLLYFEGHSDSEVAHDAEAQATELEQGVWQDTASADADSERLHIPTVASQFHLASDDDTDSVMHKFETSPAVRKLGKEYNLDLSTIHGSGPQGRLLKSDVLTYLQEQGLLVMELGTAATATITAPAAAPVSHLEQPQEEEIVTLKGYHRLMVSSMTAALEIPHMCFGDELQVDRLLQCRRDLKDHDNISILAMLLKACSLALTQYPTMNAIVHDIEQCQLKLLANHNLGVAMDTPRGLVVPIIPGVQNKSLLEIQFELDRLKALASESKLTQDDLQPPSFTLSNIGSVGGTYMSPVIVPPQLAMGAIGRIQTLPRFDNAGGVVPASIMHVSWAGDHRFLDGATLGRFNAVFKSYVENPVRMVAHLH